jgi:CheY-like chemotaxis protein
VKTILLADDSITIQKVVELTFSEGDYQVVCVSNGAQALKKVGEIHPNIILLDVIMPEKNGYEVCEELKHDPSTSGIPILLLTGTFEPFDRKRAESAGADGHLTKPFESQLLISKVEELIAKTPTVVSSEEAGNMEVIAGGEIFRVDAPVPPAPAVAGGSASPGRGGEPLQVPPPFPPAAASEAGPIRPVAPPPPAPEPGGSYVGFADLGAGLSDEPEIVPDRFDADRAASPSSTMRLDRHALLRGSDLDPDDPALQAPGATDRFEGGAFQDLTAAFEMQDADEAVPTVSPQAEPVWSPPPEAPPAESWQNEEPETPSAPTAGAAPPSAVDAVAEPGNGTFKLTPEALDLIAERVVQQMADRVVREIAWEVIPQVAEAIVRQRIKELEEDKGDDSH